MNIQNDSAVESQGKLTSTLGNISKLENSKQIS